MSEYNRLLNRQIRRHLGEDKEISPELDNLFRVISDSYRHYEEDRKLLERAMDISSEELFEKNSQLRSDADSQKVVIKTLRDSLSVLRNEEPGLKDDLWDDEDIVSITQTLKNQVTKRRDAEKKLRNSESNLSALVENTSDAIFSLDRDLNLITFNSVSGTLFEMMFNNPPRLGVNIKEFLPPKAYRYWKGMYDRALAGEGYTAEQHVSVLGAVQYFETSFSPILSEGEVLGVTVFSRNITQRKEFENKRNQLVIDLEKANRELREFAYITSHDLKSPLRAIGSLVDWLATDYHDKFDEQGQESLQLLITRVKRMYNFIDGMLQFAKIGRSGLEKEWVDLNELVEGVIRLSLLVNDRIVIEVQDQLPKVFCERLRIEQLFQNLLSNAIKYNDKPDGKVVITCREVNGGRSFEFAIADNGIGIEEKHFDKIFQIFQTLETRDTMENTGIGLTIAKKIVEIHGGNIWLESKASEGTTFYFTLEKAEVPNFDLIGSDDLSN